MNEMIERITDVLTERGVLMVQKEDAIAILRAIREPTEAMIRAGLDDYASSIWRDMVNAAMEDDNVQTQ